MHKNFHFLSDSNHSVNIFRFGHNLTRKKIYLKFKVEYIAS